MFYSFIYLICALLKNISLIRRRAALGGRRWAVPAGRTNFLSDLPIYIPREARIRWTSHCCDWCFGQEIYMNISEAICMYLLQFLNQPFYKTNVLTIINLKLNKSTEANKCHKIQLLVPKLNFYVVYYLQTHFSKINRTLGICVIYHMHQVLSINCKLN